MKQYCSKLLSIGLFLATYIPVHPLKGVFMITKLDTSTHTLREHGPFQIRRMHPGAMLGNAADGGFGGLGVIDHANLSPGLTVGMHEHRNDEIISYLREGVMVHQDSTGASEEVRPNRLMVMNSGAGFSHEEHVPGPGNVRMLQIFVRPIAPDLKPGVQFIDLAETYSLNKWRLLSGPEGLGAPTTVRQTLMLHDVRLEAGQSIPLPNQIGFDAWLYVFAGEVKLGDTSLTTNDAVAMTGEHGLTLHAAATSDLVLFLIDRSAPASRAGTLSGR
jgi:quercetin 2,3-dioxygenase